MRKALAVFIILNLLAGISVSLPSARAELTNEDFDWSYTHYDWKNTDTHVYSSWEVVNASSELGIDVEGAILEISIVNWDYTGEYSGGVRARGSSLERRLAMDSTGDSLQRPETQIDWLVQAGTGVYSGMFEQWEGQNEINIEIVGWFSNVSFTEMFTYMDLDTADAWTSHNVNTEYGVPLNSVMMVQCFTRGTTSGQTVGIRSTNQSYDRYYPLSGKNDANGQYNAFALPVQVDASGNIEYYVDIASSNESNILITGYFGAGEMYFSEHWVDLNPSVSGSWETFDLSIYNPISNSTVALVHGNDYGLSDWEQQESDNIGSPSRYRGYSIRGSADSGHFQPLSLNVDIDQNDQFNAYHTAHASQRLYYAGYFYDYNAPAVTPSDFGNYLWHGFMIAGIILMTYSPIHIVKQFNEADEYEDMVIGLMFGFIAFMIGLGLFYTWITYT